MRVENRPVYIADNGTEFDSQVECEKHEIEMKMVRILSDSTIWWGGTSAHEVVEHLCQNKDEFVTLLTKYQILCQQS